MEGILDEPIKKTPSKMSLSQHLRSAEKVPISKDEIITKYFESIPISLDQGDAKASESRTTTGSSGGSAPTVQALATNEVSIASKSRTDNGSARSHQKLDDICVCVRIKPFHAQTDNRLFNRKPLLYDIQEEKSNRQGHVCTVKSLNVHLGYEERKYRFANIFDADASDEDVTTYIWPLLRGKLRMHTNVSLMFYGQTGTGKTYTMDSLFKSTVHKIFAQFEDRLPEGKAFQIGYMQVYCDVAYDLLCNDASENAAEISQLDFGQPLSKNQSLGKKVPTVSVQSATEAVDLIENARKRRARRNHSLNVQSSRSHTFIVLGLPVFDEKPLEVTFIDLAGSERVRRTGSIGQAFDEGVSINRSLSSLGRVFTSMKSERAMIHGGSNPSNKAFLYRGSLFTHYIYSISNSFFILIANISSEASSASETKNTLDFASMSQNHSVTPEKQMNDSVADDAKISLDDQSSSNDRHSQSKDEAEACQNTKAELISIARELYEKMERISASRCAFLSKLLDGVQRMRRLSLISEQNGILQKILENKEEQIELMRSKTVTEVRATHALATQTADIMSSHPAEIDQELIEDGAEISPVLQDKIQELAVTEASSLKTIYESVIDAAPLSISDSSMNTSSNKKQLQTTIHTEEFSIMASPRNEEGTYSTISGFSNAISHHSKPVLASSETEEITSPADYAILEKISFDGCSSSSVSIANSLVSAADECQHSIKSESHDTELDEFIRDLSSSVQSRSSISSPYDPFHQEMDELLSSEGLNDSHTCESIELHQTPADEHCKLDCRSDPQTEHTPIHAEDVKTEEESSTLSHEFPATAYAPQTPQERPIQELSPVALSLTDHEMKSEIDSLANADYFFERISIPDGPLFDAETLDTYDSIQMVSIQSFFTACAASMMLFMSIRSFLLMLVYSAYKHLFLVFVS